MFQERHQGAKGKIVQCLPCAAIFLLFVFRIDVVDVVSRFFLFFLSVFFHGKTRCFFIITAAYLKSIKLLLSIVCAVLPWLTEIM